MDKNKAKAEVLAASQELVERGLVARTWGNVSCRISDKQFAITPSGIGYDRLTPDHIVVVDIDTLDHEGNIKPSSEKGIHAAAYKQNLETNFVIHTHQTYATCLSIAGFSELEAPDTLGGKIGLADYGLSGTKKLKKNVELELAKGCCAILMKNHGAVLTGPDRSAAFERAVILEDVCRETMKSLPGPTSCQPDMTSKRIDGNVGTLHKGIYEKYPDINCVAQADLPAVEEVMKHTKVMPAIVDDFAQMVGNDMKGTLVEEAIPKLEGRNAVYILGLGVLTMAADESDCQALLTLVEKNALAYLNASQYGTPKPLSFIDRKLMRFVYVKKYSKRK